MLSRKAYEKFMRDIQKTDDADNDSKQKAKNILKTMTDDYSNRIAERVAYGRQMAELFQSVLGATGNAKQP